MTHFALSVVTKSREERSSRALSDKENSIRTNRGIEGDYREVLLSSGYSFGTFLGCMARLLVCGKI